MHSPAVTRTAGVSAIAIAGLLGSVITALTGGGLLLVAGVVLASSGAAAQPPPAPMTTGTVSAIVALMGGVTLAFAGWGVASAVGLLRLRNWGRVSFVAFAALLVVWSSCVLVGALVMLAVPAPSLDPAAPPWLLRAVVTTMMGVALMGAGCGVWWLVFLNRASVKRQFGRELDAGSPHGDRIPASVAVIGWLLIASAVALPLQFVAAYPVVAFGMMLPAWAGRVLATVVLVLGAVAGIGLLRRRRRAHALAVALYAYGVANVLVTVAVPGGISRMRRTWDVVAAEQALDPGTAHGIFWGTTVVSVAVAVLFLWLLMSRREAFLRACRTEESPAPLAVP